MPKQPRRRPSFASSNTPLRDAIIVGDLPTATLWLQHAGQDGKPFERGLAMMEALADPLFEGPDRAACLETLITSLEEWIALEERGAASLLAILQADAPRRLPAPDRARVRRIAELFEVGTPSATDRKRYAVVREALIDRAPPIHGGREVCRIDDGGGLVPVGAPVSVPQATAVALAELRAAAALLCSTLAEAAIGRFGDLDHNYVGLDVRCARNVLEVLRTQSAELEAAAGAARRRLARPDRE